RALAECGRLKPAEVFAPALDYARDGFPVHKNFIRYLASPAFQQLRKTTPSLEAVYYPDGRLPGFGTRLKQPAMARLIESLIAGGADAFYRGEAAELIDQESRRLNGFLRKSDLARYQSQWVEPLSVGYRGLTVYQVPPNSQGIAMLQQLRVL